MKTQVAFVLALTLSLTGIVGNHAEATHRTSKPDLTVSAVSAPSPASPNATIVVSGTVTNQGKASAKAFGVAYYLSTNPSSTTGAAMLGTGNVSSLAVGASVALVTSFTVPGSTASGTFYVVAVADSTRVIVESNESNNSLASGALVVQDSTPPSISAVNANGITANNATIAWATNETGTSQVEYGTTSAYGSLTSLSSSLVTSHGVGLSSLVAGTLYHFRVYSKDAAGNAAVSGDYSFTTATTTAAGKTYYVATTGNDANPGTSTLPFRTISRGVKVLAPGDTLSVRGGVYAEAVHDIPSGTSWSAPVTVAAYPGETVTVQPGATGWPAVYLYDQSYIVLDRLIFDGGSLGSGVIGIFIDQGSHHIRLQDGEVKNAPMSGVFIDDGAHHNEVINMAIHDNGTTDFDHGIYIEGASNLVEDSDIYRNAGWGVHIYREGVTGVANYNIVRTNRIYNNARIGGRGVGIILSSGNGNMAYNNLIWGNAAGIHIAYGTPTDSQVYNNTIYANRDWGIRIDPDGTNSIIKNNILHQNGTGYYGVQFSNVGAGTQSSKNLTGTDPKFANASTYDFHLQSGSPAIDQGDLVTILTTDFDGTARPQGLATDIGAMEFH